MNDFLDQIKPQVRELRAYTLEPYRASVKLNQNENPWDAPQAIKEEAVRRLRERAWSRYPDFVPVSLHERLARFADWTPAGIVAGNGSNELIQALLMVTVKEGARVLISEPTFALYRQITTVLGGRIISVPPIETFAYDVDALREAIVKHQPQITIICSPNNPTGAIIDEPDLVELLEASSGLIALDEAYFDFANRTLAPLLKTHRNLVVFRTFSKAMALAALRVGYLLAAPELAREIGKAVLPYNLNAVSQTIAEVALDMYDAEIAPLVRRIIAERNKLYSEICSIQGFAVVPSQANFMLVRVPEALTPRQVFAELLERDVLVRDVSSYPMLQNYLRVSVGTPAENDKLLRALHEIIETDVRC